MLQRTVVDFLLLNDEADRVEALRNMREQFLKLFIDDSDLGRGAGPERSHATCHRLPCHTS